MDFSGVWAKIDRAKYHSADLQRNVKAYWDRNPYELVADTETNPGSCLYFVRSIREPLPEVVPLIVGDCVHNLRTAFDHFAFAVAPGNEADVAFPVFRHDRAPGKGEWDRLVKDKLKSAPAAVQQAVKVLQPYPTGAEEWLWTIHQLDIVDKHHLLLTVAGSFSGITIDAAAVMRTFQPNDEFLKTATAEFTLFRREPVRVEPGTQLFLTGKGGTPYDGHPKFTVDVAFGELASVKGKPLGPTLATFIERGEELLKSLIAFV